MMKTKHMYYLSLIIIICTISMGCIRSRCIKIPYFNKLTTDEVCGGQPAWCQPTISEEWFIVKGGIDYNGEIKNYLGRKFENIFNTLPCASPTPTLEDIDVLGTNRIRGTLTESETIEFKAKISADLIRCFTREAADLPDSIKASIQTELEQKTNAVIEREIDLEYKRIQLKPTYIDNVIPGCFWGLGSKQKICTGISLITVKGGEWVSNTYTEAFASLESSAKYRGLSSEIKAKYNDIKNRLLKGKFESLSFIFAVCYIKKK